MSNAQEFGTVGELLDILKDVPRDRPIMFQVCATNGQAWNLIGSFVPQLHKSKWALMQMRHPYLVNLPGIAFHEPSSASGDV